MELDLQGKRPRRRHFRRKKFENMAWWNKIYMKQIGECWNLHLAMTHNGISYQEWHAFCLFLANLKVFVVNFICNCHPWWVYAWERR